MQFDHKVVVVTGAGNGIGRELAQELIRRGGRVAAIDIRPDDLNETVALVDGEDRIAAFVCDITDRDATRALPEQVAATFGVVDGLINNAGIIQPFVTIDKLAYTDIDRVIDVNLYGTIHMVKAFLPGLLGRPEACIANVSSMGGFLPVPGQTIYGATKAAVKLMTEGLYAELLDTRVGVSVVMPGAVGTDITTNSGVEVPAQATGSDAATMKVTSASDAARIILDGIEAGKLHIYVGSDSRMMSLANRIAPRRSTHMIQKKMKALLSTR